LRVGRVSPTLQPPAPGRCCRPQYLARNRIAAVTFAYLISATLSRGNQLWLGLCVGLEGGRLREIARALACSRDTVREVATVRNPPDAPKGLPDRYIHHGQRDASRQNRVTGGCIERDGKFAERFPFVAAASRWRWDQYSWMLHQFGVGSCTPIRMVSDEMTACATWCGPPWDNRCNRSAIGFASIRGSASTQGGPPADDLRRVLPSRGRGRA
jgi:hypothetical protein